MHGHRSSSSSASSGLCYSSSSSGSTDRHCSKHRRSFSRGSGSTSSTSSSGREVVNSHVVAIPKQRAAALSFMVWAAGGLPFSTNNVRHDNVLRSSNSSGHRSSSVVRESFLVNKRSAHDDDARSHRRHSSSLSRSPLAYEWGTTDMGVGMDSQRGRSRDDSFQEYGGMPNSRNSGHNTSGMAMPYMTGGMGGSHGGGMGASYGGGMSGSYGAGMGPGTGASTGAGTGPRPGAGGRPAGAATMGGMPGAGVSYQSAPLRTAGAGMPRQGVPLRTAGMPAGAAGTPNMRPGNGPGPNGKPFIVSVSP